MRLASILALFLFPAFVAAEESLTVPFITTPDEVVHRMLRAAQTRPADLVVDLGSGDGRIVIAAAKQFGARGLASSSTPAWWRNRARCRARRGRRACLLRAGRRA